MTAAEPFIRAEVAARVPAVVAACHGIEWITEAGRVERLSRDFAWFSPVLVRALEGLQADAAARPRSEAEIAAVVAACVRERVPLTLRGSGTGNYGQCTPLYGGVILDLSSFAEMLWVRDGIGRAQAGIRLGEFDRQMQPAGWELRCVPSTFRSATLGGLYGGGFGGIGSINFGPLAATGNVLGLKAMTIEAEPRAIVLRAPEALLLHHVYGTNGLVIELEVALAPAHRWLECIVVFEHFDAALDFADAVAQAPGLVKKSVTFFAAPVPDLLTQLSAHLPRGRHAVFIIAAEASQAALRQIIGDAGGEISYCKMADEVRRVNRTIAEFTWNHTTLHALKIDKTLTYIQSGFQPGEHLRQARKLHDLLGDEVLMHLEFIRTLDGRMTCAGLQLIRYASDERLNTIMQIHRDHGVSIANPHVFHVEDGKQGQINPQVVAMKARLDPHGLLNPGKLRGWDQRDAVLSGAIVPLAHGTTTLPRF